MGPSLTSKLLQATAVTTSATLAAFAVWTKHCHFVDLSPTTDPIFQSAFYRKYNPNSNPTAHDLCVRKIPIFKLKPELVEDAERGGTKMVEAFCAGVWGGFGYAIQRHYLTTKYRQSTTPSATPQSHPPHLWTRPLFLTSPYSPGTLITNHFEILSKSHPPNSALQTILIRCGDSPSNQGVRESDGLFEIAADVRVDRGYAEFRLKSVFYRGLGDCPGGEGERKGPMPAWMWWMHKQYTKLLMESAVRNVKR